MQRRRVVITGLGLASPIGNDLDSVSTSLQNGLSGIKAQPNWTRIGQLGALVGGNVEGVDSKMFPRKKTRSMGRVSLLGAFATKNAISDSGLTSELLSSGITGLSYGSTHGSTSELEVFSKTLFLNESLAKIPGSAYLKFMSHTCASSLAELFEIRGRVVPSIAACASGSLAIGLGFEAIQAGSQDIMVCGGAEELHFLHAGVFDILYAASAKFNDNPELTPRPYDERRDGLVVAEGAGTIILEELEHAKRRDAKIYGEVRGFGTCCDGNHVTNPSVEGMSKAMQLSLMSAGVAHENICYVNGHGTGTEAGDIAESLATEVTLGNQVPFSSTKSYTGHTLGACGAIETIFCMAMFRDGFVPHTRNLENVDPRCAKLNYIVREPARLGGDIVMNNNFAFGGINTSLVLQAFS